jgi:hypothetical protein
MTTPTMAHNLATVAVLLSVKSEGHMGGLVQDQEWGLERMQPLLPAQEGDMLEAQSVGGEMSSDPTGELAAPLSVISEQAWTKVGRCGAHR